MKIQTVEYRKLITHGEYNNTSIGAVAEVDTMESPEAALLALQSWVDGELDARVKIPERLYDAERRLRAAEYDLQQKRHDIERARAKWDEIKALLAAHGVALEDSKELFSDMPF